MQNTKHIRSIRLYQSTVPYLVAGVGFFIARPSRIVEMHAKLSFASFLLALWGIASRKRHTVAFSLAHPRPPPEVFESKANPQPKRQGSPLDCLAFLVAGVGFEPHDLRVMSGSILLCFKIDRVTRTYSVQRKATKKATNGYRRWLSKFNRLFAACSYVYACLVILRTEPAFPFSCFPGIQQFYFEGYGHRTNPDR